jgi:transcription-repair coupling factor (superfamily II helicase)
MNDFYHSSAAMCWSVPPSSRPASTFPTPTPSSSTAPTPFGLAQLHQLRGRVGRSHPGLCLSADAAPQGHDRRRGEAPRGDQEAGELGVGFTLATHDLEIRGAGELLGEEQSGQIESVGFALYSEMLDRAVNARSARDVRPISTRRSSRSARRSTCIQAFAFPKITCPTCTHV